MSVLTRCRIIATRFYAFCAIFCSLSCTDANSASSYVRFCRFIQMSLRAMCFTRVYCQWVRTSQSIRSVCNHINMRWIDTTAYIAKMVTFHIGRHCFNKPRISKSVTAITSAFYAKCRVCIRTCFAIVFGINPTRGFISCIRNGYMRKETSEQFNRKFDTAIIASSSCHEVISFVSRVRVVESSNFLRPVFIIP